MNTTPTAPLFTDATRRYGVPFDDRVDKSGDCWLWTGATTTAGYGSYYSPDAGKVVYAHRYSWEREHGPIPDGVHILHQCDNPPCVRPLHLFAGSVSDNMLDMARKGRAPRRLTPDKVREIRQLHAEGWTQEEIAKAYGVTRPNVGYIVRRETWAWV